MTSKRDFFRGRRLRNSAALRELVRETTLHPQDLVQPYFVVEHDDPDYAQAIPSMPGQYQMGISALLKSVDEAVSKGLRSLILFGIPKTKDERGSQAYARQGIIQQAIARLKERHPELIVITDVCLCEYTSHGHCGVIENGRVLNDPTLDLLAEAALSHARSGADIVAPSDMMDGRVQAIRQALDAEGYIQLPILSYAVKYASSFYGPFRDAAQSTPQFGDRKSYQMDPANSKESLREALADLQEKADMLMVKPALPYLDIISKLKETFSVPIAAYQVSGEYAMFKAAHEQGWLDEKPVALESLTSIKRAGADLILSYYTENVLEWLG
jgi:porphobilinogen synthase